MIAKILAVLTFSACCIPMTYANSNYDDNVTLTVALTKNIHEITTCSVIPSDWGQVPGETINNSYGPNQLPFAPGDTASLRVVGTTPASPTVGVAIVCSEGNQTGSYEKIITNPQGSVPFQAGTTSFTGEPSDGWVYKG